MILSNVEILRAIADGRLEIGDLKGAEDPGNPPFNTTAIDLHLGNTIAVPRKAPAAFDLRQSGLIRQYQSINSDRLNITEQQPYCLVPNTLVLANTRERVNFPITPGKAALSARVEGRSSVARCGILVHFTAPTIHTGFWGTVTLEIMNLGPLSFLLFPDMAICQLIIEQVEGAVVPTANQFAGQLNPTGR
jgi:dCTP deaminase